MRTRKKVASLYAEITADPKQAQSGLAAVSRSAKDAKKSFDDLGKSGKTSGAGVKELGAQFAQLSGMALKAAGAVGAVAVAFQQAMALGREGAVVLQTAESFDRLVDSVGGSADMLDQLRQASRGTIDDMTLMSATATLLAGTQGELGKSLADAAPRILEIAGAAAKLNPRLGDAAFLYESLMTGIKRGSPMLIDNTGITLKLGEANELMAASLGKTVEQLTADEQKMAILNATLAAGDVMLRQVGGSAESLVDPFDRMNASLTNVANKMKSELVPVLADAALGADQLLNLGDNFEPVNQALAAGAETYADYYNALEGVKQQFGVLGLLLPQLSVAQWENVRATAAMQERQEEVAETYSWLGEQHQRRQQLLEDENQTVTEAASVNQRAASDIGSAWSIAYASIDEARRAVDDFYSAIKTGAASEIQRQIEALDFKAAGGQMLDAMALEINKALLSGAITPDQAREYLGALYVASQDLETDLDNIDATKAAENIASTLNISLAEARDLLADIENRANYINGLRASLQIDVSVTGNGAGLVTGGGIVNVSGNDVPAALRAGGGNMMSGRPYLVGEVGPELVVPRADAYAFSKMATESIVNNYTSYSVPAMNVYGGNADPNEIANAAIAKLNGLARQARRSGVQYAGG